MSWLTGIGVLAMLAAVLAFRTVEEPVAGLRVKTDAIREARVEREASVETGAASIPRAEPALRTETLSTAAAAVVVEPEAVVGAMQPGLEEKLHREMQLSILETGLELSPTQRSRIESFLLERDEAVARYHATIRESKVLVILEHDRRAREFLAATQAQIASVLAPDQSAKYLAMLEDGKLKEGISYEITPDLAVIR